MTILTITNTRQNQKIVDEKEEMIEETKKEVEIGMAIEKDRDRWDRNEDRHRKNYDEENKRYNYFERQQEPREKTQRGFSAEDKVSSYKNAFHGIIVFFS